MIKSFKNKETNKIFKGFVSKKYPIEIQVKARMKLRILDNVDTLRELRIPPSNHLKALKGKRKNEYSIRINDQWRICFEWKDGHAYEVMIEDYH